MSAFILKVIACITMFTDHIGYLIFGTSSWLNYVGRLAFPIFAFQISEGFIHTKNVKKYLIRLFIFALISQIPFMLFHSIIDNSFHLNVIFTLLFGLVSIIVYDKCNKFLGIIICVVLGFIAQVSSCDYGFYGVAITFVFYVFRKNKWLFTTSFLLITIIRYLHSILPYFTYGPETLKRAFSYYLPYAICTLMSIFILLLYNKKKGINTRYLLYLFYPLHLIFIYTLSLII